LDRHPLDSGIHQCSGDLHRDFLFRPGRHASISRARGGNGQDLNLPHL